MKKFVRIMAAVLILVATLSLTGCGLASKLDGKWEGTMDMEGFEVDVTLEFDKKEGEVTSKMEIMGQSEKDTVDFEVDGKELIIDDEEVDYELKGKTLTLELEDGIELELEKVK